MRGIFADTVRPVEKNLQYPGKYNLLCLYPFTFQPNICWSCDLTKILLQIYRPVTNDLHIITSCSSTGMFLSSGELV